MSYKYEILAGAPLLYWRLGETATSGGAKDETNNSMTGSYQGAVTLGGAGAIVDDTDTCAHLSGQGVVSDSAMPALTAWTVAGWFSVDASNPLNQKMMNDDNNSCWDVYINNAGDLHFHTRSSPGGASPVNINAGACPTGGWFHCVFAYDGDTVYAYVNGVLKGSSAADPGRTWNSILRLGLDGYGSNDYVGSADEITVYPRALTATEVRRHYWAGKGFKDYKLEVLSGEALGYWRMDASSGASIVQDEMGATDGAVTGAPTFEIPGLIGSGYAMAFSTGDYLDVLDASGGHVFTAVGDGSAQGYTVEMWAVPNASSTASNSDTAWRSAETAMELRGAGSGTNSVPFNLGQDNGVACIRRKGSDGVVDLVRGSTATNDGQTHHIAATITDTEIRLYVDGKLDGSTSLTPHGWDSSVGSNACYFKIGARSRDSGGDDASFQGTIDEAVVYDRALSAAEIRRRYLTGTGEKGYGLGVLAVDPEAYWTLGESAGASVFVDSTGNGHTGTINGSPTLGSTSLIDGGPTSAYFNGADYMQTDGTEMNATSAVGSLEAWVAVASVATDQAIFDTEENRDRCIWIEGGKVKAAMYWSSAFVTLSQGTATIQDGKPFHVAFNWDISSGLELYVDGELVDSYAGSQTDAASTAPTRWGAIGDGSNPTASNGLVGRLGELAVYPRMLLDSEVAQHYGLGIYGSTAALYKIAGTVTADGSPAQSVVRAYRWDNGDLIGEATSDPADGSYSITDIADNSQALVVTLPDTGLRPLAHGPITPVKAS